MYQALLTRKYLTSKIMPLLAMIAVALSVATVLVTWSIMGGFLKTLLVSGERIIGDVAIKWPNVGFRHYDDLIERLEADPRIAAATPMIETFGLVQLPDGRVAEVYIRGVEPESLDSVTNYYDTLWWRPLDRRARKDVNRDDPRVVAEEKGDLESDRELKSIHADLFERNFQNGKTLTRVDPATGGRVPAAVPGIELTGLNMRTEAGVYVPLQARRAMPDGSVGVMTSFLPRDGFIGLTLLRLDANGNPVDSLNRRLPVANEFQTGIYDHDRQTMLVPLGYLQQLLGMDEARRVSESSGSFGFDIDPETGEPIQRPIQTTEVDPARVTTVLVRGATDARGRALAPEEVAAACEEIYAQFESAHTGEVPSALDVPIDTWRSAQRTMIAAVEKETGLVLFIFGIVCFTTVFLVLAIFWSMVSEKTKDIGVLRSLGASTWGVAWLWLRYGIAIGVVGALMGTVAGYLITTNINAIHDWLGSTFNMTVWDPRVYYFVEIPREVEGHKAVIVAVAGVVTCLVGAAIPATRAARMDPVKALRFE